jgi:Uma2 family endonuclease
MRVHIPATGDYTYPDQVVVCGEPEFLPGVKPDTLLNPTVIIEVLSPTTSALDRGAKFDSYRTLASLQDYVLVAQDKCLVVHYTREADGAWRMTEAHDLAATIPLTAIACSLPLSEVYAKVSLPG